MENQLSFDSADTGFTIASSRQATAILVDSKDDQAVHIAANTFADDVERVTGKRPAVHIDTLPKGTTAAIVATTAGSTLLSSDGAVGELLGKWEAFDIRVRKAAGIESALCVTGSDKVGTGSLSQVR
jgi:hypothetical protein